MINKIKTMLSSEGVKPSSFSFDSPPLDYSLNKDQSLVTFETGFNVLERVSKACEKEGFPRPILSGGAIRDAMLGFLPNDYDIFVDVTDIGDEELTQEDRFLLLADACFPEAGGWTYERGGNDAYSKRASYFQLYTGNRPGHRPVQLVGHTAPCITTDPLLFTKDYPYNLIRNYATLDEIVIAPEAMLGFEKKTIDCNPKGYDKALEWVYRSMEPISWVVNRHVEDTKSKAQKGLEAFRNNYRAVANYSLQVHAVRPAGAAINQFRWAEPIGIHPRIDDLEFF